MSWAFLETMKRIQNPKFIDVSFKILEHQTSRDLTNQIDAARYKNESTAIKLLAGTTAEYWIANRFEPNIEYVKRVDICCERLEMHRTNRPWFTIRMTSVMLTHKMNVRFCESGFNILKIYHKTVKKTCRPCPPGSAL